MSVYEPAPSGMTRERQAHEARLAVDEAAVKLQSVAWSAGTRRLAYFAEEDAALAEFREALADLFSLATMTDDEFEDTLDGAPEHQWQVTTPAEVNAR